MKTLNNLKAKAKDLSKLGACITKTEQCPYPTEALQKQSSVLIQQRPYKNRAVSLSNRGLTRITSEVLCH